jgi:hypothetical protein
VVGRGQSPTVPECGQTEQTPNGPKEAKAQLCPKVAQQSPKRPTKQTLNGPKEARARQCPKAAKRTQESSKTVRKRPADTQWSERGQSPRAPESGQESSRAPESGPKEASQNNNLTSEPRQRWGKTSVHLAPCIIPSIYSRKQLHARALKEI